VRTNDEYGGAEVVGLTTASPGVSSSGAVRDLACSSSTSCVAVGSDGAGRHAAWHFDGTAWTPDVLAFGAEPDTDMTAISCPSSSFCAAIGTYAFGTSRRPTLLTWDGSGWASPPSPFASFDDLDTVETDIDCPSPSFCAATIRAYSDVGEFPDEVTAMWIWDGTTWTALGGPAPTTVDCASPTSCVGLDWRTSYTWDGTTLSSRPLGATAPEVRGLSCAAPDRCVALLGVAGDTISPTRLLTWDGTAATVADLPAPAGQGVVAHDVSCVGPAPARCVVVGQVGPIGGPPSAGAPHALVGDGSGTWTAPALPAGGPGVLRAVSCADTAECQVLGEGSVAGGARPQLALALTLDTWNLAPEPPGAVGAPVPFAAISCVPTSCQAIGRVGPAGAHDTVAATYRWTYPG
jgi:hypothetical protein